MDNLNLVVMGKTGAGKSTLINAVLGEDLAPTGSGQPVTKKNQMYTKSALLPLSNNQSESGTYGMVAKKLNLYDTVGLEIDATITQKTLQEIKNYIQKIQMDEKVNDLTMVWFCVNYRSSRFESYELDLIKSLSMEYEMPFILVLTQCYSDEQSELEKQIKRDFQEITIVRVLAKENKLRGGTIPAFGITELLRRSVIDYDHSKVAILKNKLIKLAEERKKRISAMKTAGAACVAKYSQKAEKIGYIPGGCIPFVHGLCKAMIGELNKIVGIDSSIGFASDIFGNIVVGLITTPLMVVPLLSAGVSYAYVSTVGESYLDSLMVVIENSLDEELKNNNLMAKRIKEEIKKRTGDEKK